MANFPPFDPSSWANWQMPFANPFDTGGFPQPLQQFPPPLPQDAFGLHPPFPFSGQPTDFNFFNPTAFPPDMSIDTRQYPNFAHQLPPAPQQPLESYALPDRQSAIDHHPLPSSSTKLPHDSRKLDAADASDEEGEVKEGQSERMALAAPTDQDVKDILKQVEIMKSRKNRRKLRTDHDRLIQLKSDLLELSKRSPEWQRKIEAYLIGRPDLRTKGVHANLPQAPAHNVKNTQTSQLVSKKSRQSESGRTTANGSGSEKRHQSPIRKKSGLEESMSTTAVIGARQVMQCLKNLNLRSSELTSMGVDVERFARYCRLLGISRDDATMALNQVDLGSASSGRHSAVTNDMKNGSEVSVHLADQNQTSTSKLDMALDVPHNGDKPMSTDVDIRQPVGHTKAVSPPSSPTQLPQNQGVPPPATVSQETVPSVLLPEGQAVKLPVLSRSEIIKQKLAGLIKPPLLASETAEMSKPSGRVEQLVAVTSGAFPPRAEDKIKDIQPESRYERQSTVSEIGQSSRESLQARKLAMLQEKMAQLRNATTRKPAEGMQGTENNVQVVDQRTVPAINGNMLSQHSTSLPPISEFNTTIPNGNLLLHGSDARNQTSGPHSPFPSHPVAPPNTGIPGLLYTQQASGASTPSAASREYGSPFTLSSMRKRPVAADFNDNLVEEIPPSKKRYKRTEDVGVIIPLSDDDDEEEHEDDDGVISSSEDGEISSPPISQPQITESSIKIGSRFANAPPLSSLRKPYSISMASTSSTPAAPSPAPRSAVFPGVLHGLDERIRLLKEELAKKQARKPVLPINSLSLLQQDPKSSHGSELDEDTTQAVEMELDRLIEQERDGPLSNRSGITDVAMKPQTEIRTDLLDPHQSKDIDTKAILHSPPLPQPRSSISPMGLERDEEQSSASESLDSASMEEGEVSSTAHSIVQSRAMSIDGSAANSPTSSSLSPSPDVSDSNPSNDSMDLDDDSNSSSRPQPDAPTSPMPTTPSSKARPIEVAIDLPSSVTDEVVIPKGAPHGADSPQAGMPAAVIGGSGTSEVDAVIEAKHPSSEKKSLHPSPLLALKSFRYHPRFLQLVKGGYLSLTFSHQIDPMKPLCPTELDHGICSDPRCTFQHFYQFEMDGDKVILQLGLNGGSGENGPYKDSLRDLLTKLRTEETSGFDQVAEAVIAHRVKFFGSWL